MESEVFTEINEKKTIFNINQQCTCKEIKTLTGFQITICGKHWEEIREINKHLRNNK